MHDGAHAPQRPLRSSGLATPLTPGVGGLLLLALAACDSTTNNLLVTVTGLPPRATTLSVVAMLNGKPALSAMDVTQPLDRFGVALPQDASGHLALGLTAFDSDRCTQGTATITAELPTLRIDSPLPAALTAQSPRQCAALAPCAANTVCTQSLNPQKNTITSLWAISPTNIWGVGWYGTIIHFDGAVWSTVPSIVNSDLNALWASSANDIWAVGSAANTLHYDGKKWTSINNPAVYPLSALWGTSPTDVWTVGRNNGLATPGEFLHWNGTAWSKVVTGINGPLSGVWASSASDIFACGDNGLVLHFNGQTGQWKAMGSGTILNLTAIWGSAATQVFAVGDFGTAVRYDGTAWKTLSTGSSFPYLTRVFGDGQAVYATGDTGVLLRSSATFDSFQPYAGGATSGLLSVQPGTNGIGWVAGFGGFLGYFDARP